MVAIYYFATLAFVSLASTLPNLEIRQIYTFGPNTFIENIVVRSNSHLLLTSESVPTLFSVNPLSPSPNATAIYTFPNATGLSGITEISSDKFALVSATWDLVNTRAAVGSLNIWTIDFCAPRPVVEHVTTILNSTIFNGIAFIPNSNLILAADSALGAIWRVNIHTGIYEVAFTDSLLAPTGTDPGKNLGVNGIRISNDGKWLYFANSAQGIFARVAISPQGGKIGNVEVIASFGIPTGVAGLHIDDFALGEDGLVWIAAHPSDVIKVQAGKGVLADLQNATLFLNPTSAALGRGSQKEKNTLYVTNGGTFVGDTFELVDEGVVAIDISKL